ncbi:protein numb homolog isoform X1 [Acyrthosiphon pisum]|uniref:ACYPI002331 protein n=1 Tax=Acyrthosiphon pisum TaxID=7029 RepID=C4WXF6_ACYPI|nr:protein numb homolog [Acyrthosiphon pisum]XP_016658771.1 protein numb homolog isoform X1 [Acyrthosiphon pisum]XP_029346910.1 protein numb homolog isoform X1 [Acyrthosiphon pisum]BAH72576.1 ACYPI002331 [Acyrthosiphon pisum]|eukprot:NP_001233065.1 protein numb homolog [Acyrthosiphon pisum]
MTNYRRRNCGHVVNDTINRWPQDEIGILDGNCSFNVGYLGCVEVSEPTNSKICRESFAKLYQEYKTGISHPNSAILWITGYELRIVEKKSKNLILAQTIENVIFCASTADNTDQLFYTSRDSRNNRWLCYLIIVTDFSSDRLCRAVGFAFKVCLRRKTIREGSATNTTTSTRSIG